MGVDAAPVRRGIAPSMSKVREKMFLCVGDKTGNADGEFGDRRTTHTNNVYLMIRRMQLPWERCAAMHGFCVRIRETALSKRAISFGILISCVFITAYYVAGVSMADFCIPFRAVVTVTIITYYVLGLGSVSLSINDGN